MQAVSVEAKVADFCASVTIRQKFVNTESTPIEGNHLPVVIGCRFIQRWSFFSSFRIFFYSKNNIKITAIYQFQLEDKATVSDFTAIVDGNKIKGTIQEKEEAKNTYVRLFPSFSFFLSPFSLLFPFFLRLAV
jgi:hypothetical protein